MSSFGSQARFVAVFVVIYVPLISQPTILRLLVIVQIEILNYSVLVME